jgi:hypothetical protein
VWTYELEPSAAVLVDAELAVVMGATGGGCGTPSAAGLAWGFLIISFCESDLDSLFLMYSRHFC